MNKFRKRRIHKMQIQPGMEHITVYVLVERRVEKEPDRRHQPIRLYVLPKDISGLCFSADESPTMPIFKSLATQAKTVRCREQATTRAGRHVTTTIQTEDFLVWTLSFQDAYAGMDVYQNIYRIYDHELQAFNRLREKGIMPPDSAFYHEIYIDDVHRHKYQVLGPLIGFSPSFAASDGMDRSCFMTRNLDDVALNMCRRIARARLTGATNPYAISEWTEDEIKAGRLNV